MTNKLNKKELEHQIAKFTKKKKQPIIILYAFGIVIYSHGLNAELFFS